RRVLFRSQGQGQTVEIQVSKLTVLGEANPEDVKLTILSPKKHSLETLREQAHLRIRTNTFGAVMRTRSKLAFAVHEYFQKNGFNYMHSPRSEEHTSELQSRENLVCRLLLEKKKNNSLAL